MPSNSAVQVVALLPQVGVNGLNPDSGWPEMEGMKSKVIGTKAGIPNSIFVDTALLSAHEGRGARILADLVNAGAVQAVADGSALSAADLLTIGTVDGLPKAGSVFVGADQLTGITGTWTLAYDAGAHTYSSDRTAAAASNLAVIAIPAAMLRDAAGSGVKPVSMEIFYELDTEDADDVDVELFRTNTPADGSAVSATTLSTGQTYDADHDTAAERGDSTGAPELHTMTVTLDPNLAAVDYLNDGEGLLIELTVDDTTGGNAEFSFKGLRLSFEESLAVPNS